MSDESKYSKSGKAYYEAHKAELLAAEKDKKRWLSYYERNREIVKERNRQQYYLKQGREVPPLRPKPATAPAPPPPESTDLKRLEELVAELRSLVPEVMKKKARARVAKQPNEAAKPSGETTAPAPPATDPPETVSLTD